MIKYILVLFLLSISILYTPPALAQAIGDPLGVEFGSASGLSNTDPRSTVAGIINVALSLLGIILVTLIVYAGFLWMTAAGNDDQITKAKKILSSAIIGLIIILSAYAITRFVTDNLQQVTGAGTGR
ncbi:MAG: hypothetical protein COU35_04115 [Candidatus Magasanikbacteria bacterium CG10_big_fil_rev_8_21_14_0_10_47_10]|uniref:Uncharacterized protein n=1 Tax=Candidatus Magasanikbacteria bacterium CG10_big_fil_rev_8_21_14_0_10_47_10 TaxID=1974652 RepID=A0A2H0TPP7_9BACT|nr:MAG: hypothetical protein COU35_04115 [Candidatus Magasanikbacteria bacterium CG10_big_fil_rev_8_21_14_0_10_47_10]